MTIEEERKAFNERSAIKKALAPGVEKRKEMRQALNDNAYFIIIILISFLTVFLPPLFMGCLSQDIALAFPKSREGWVLWGILNGSTAIANVSLLVLFKLQAKQNSIKDPNFQKANEIMNNLAGIKEVFIPRSPARMNAGDYTKKIIAIIVSTFLASITLTSLILSFSWMTLLSCLVSIIITLCLSWVTMLKNEQYWCEEYLLYAEMIQKQQEESPEEGEELSNEIKEENNA